MPAICRNSISAKYGALPVPGDAIVSLPGRALAWAMNSLSDWAGEEFGTNMK
jgi:hypothetical protein